MVASLKHYIIPAVLLLAGCGQGEDQSSEATSPAVETSTSATPVAEPAPAAEMVTAAAPATVSGAVAPAESNNSLFRASITSELEPVVINQLHNWTLHLQTADGAPVEDATITVTGSMPAHSHGMPTNPQVTANLGGGDYRVEGIQFQMGGEWEVIFNITSGAVTDAVIFRFTLQY